MSIVAEQPSTFDLVLVATGGTALLPRAGTLFVLSELLASEGLVAMTLFGDPEGAVGARELEEVAVESPGARCVTVSPDVEQPGLVALSFARDLRERVTVATLRTARPLLAEPHAVALEIVSWLRAHVPSACGGRAQPCALHDPAELELALLRASLFVATMGYVYEPFSEVDTTLRKWLTRAIPAGGEVRWSQLVEVTADLQALGQRVGAYEGDAFTHGWRLGHARALAEAVLAAVEQTPEEPGARLQRLVTRAGLSWCVGRRAEADAIFAKLASEDAAFAHYSRAMLALAHDDRRAADNHLASALEVLGDDGARVVPDHARHSRWEVALVGRRFRDLVLCALAANAYERRDGKATVDFATRALACTDHPLHALQFLSRGLHLLAAAERDPARLRALRTQNLDALERSFAIEPRADEIEGALELAKALGDFGAIARWQARAEAGVTADRQFTVSL